MSIHLLGGGRDNARSGALLRSFVAEARAHAGSRPPVIAVLLVLEPDVDAEDTRFRELVLAAGATAEEVRVTAVVEGERFAADAADADGVFVGGGLTPAYHDAVVDIAPALRDRVAAGMPYAGFSAGAAIAARQALVGGWLREGVPVASEDAGEELDELEVREGLGLVSFAVDVHAAQWGTVTRLIAAVTTGLVEAGVAVDEFTALVVGADESVHGDGHVWRVDAADNGTRVTLVRATAS